MRKLNSNIIAKHFSIFLFFFLFFSVFAKTAFSFTIQSLDFKNNGFIPKKHTCMGDNLHFYLKWSNPPKTTKSFAIVVKDLDAPGGYYHWLVYDIPNTITEINAKTNLHIFKQGINSALKVGYIGPCPQAGPALHRYLITLYALDKFSLGLPNGANIPLVEEKIQKHTIAKVQIIGVFSLR